MPTSNFQVMRSEPAPLPKYQARYSAGSQEGFEWVMEFIAASDNFKSQFIDRWQEVLANFIVEPMWGGGSSSVPAQKSPYHYGYVYRPSRLQIVLKDPETHKLVMAYRAKLMRALFGDPRREYVKADPVGYEDAPQKAPTATRVLRRVFGLRGHYRTLEEWINDGLLYGTGVLRCDWRYEETYLNSRSLSVDQYGTETSTIEPVQMPTYDDVCFAPVSITDFFPDPGRARIEEMCGAGEKFRIAYYQAKMKVRAGLWDAQAVEAAFAVGGSQQPDARRSENFRRGLDLPSDDKSPSQFRDKIGYDYWGIVPYEGGEKRKRITVIGGYVVSEKDYPLTDEHLPYHACVINPVAGRFYGISPAEVVRYDQSFADALKILLAEAVIRQVHPPIAVDPASGMEASDLGALKAWKADAIVPAPPNAVSTLQYNANVPAGMNLYGMLKESIQESSGARGAISGEAGPNREAATAAAFRVQGAMDQPELVARLIEEDALPPLGLAILRRYQQFVVDSEDLAMRIGDVPEPANLADIMGDFDVAFSGTRQSMTRQQKLTAVQTFAQLAQGIPALQAAVPWTGPEVAQLVGDILELPELAANMGSPETMALNSLLTQLQGQGGGAPPAPTQANPPGLLPAQASGGGP